MATATRLVQQIVPHHYRIHLDVQLDDFTFAANQTIEFELVKPARQLVFHGMGLTIASAALDHAPATGFTFDDDSQTVTFELTEEAAAGRHTLELEFSGTINPGLSGFYRSSYQHDGQTKWLATTQFEPGHARQAFVCIDEPAAKAVFELSLTVPAVLTALSNGAIVSETPVEDNRKTVQFAPSPKMSTYLVAYVVGNLECLEGATPEGVIVRVWATPGKQDQLAFALETAQRTLSFYNEYFDEPYPLPKLDMVAVPDFASGAMENWGLVTYRETALLLNPTLTSLAQKQRVAEVITHELAHQWFGNLVTMEWWDDLWLNEGFASWVEVPAEDYLFPEWEVWVQFVGEAYAWAQGDDALANTHPIEVEVEDPRAVDEIFDGISYGKGACIIHMLHGYVGPDDFRRGLQLYLKRHQYGNATTRDLWAALEEASGKPVAAMMSAWTTQPGYPILMFENGAARQQRFYASPREAAAATDQPVWPVPLQLVTASGTTAPLVLEQAVTPLSANLQGTDWFKPNPDQTGFYRTHYTPAMVEALAAPLTDGTLEPTDRTGIASDVLAAAQAGLTPSTVVMQLLQTLRQETNLVTWSELAGAASSLLGIIEDEAVRTRFEHFGRWFNQPARERLGWEARPQESAFDTLLRPLVLQQAIRFGDEATVAEARQRFEAFLKTGQINPDLRSALAYAVARYGTAADFDTLLNLYRRETVPQVKLNWLAALGRFRQPELVQRSLELGVSADVRPQDTIYCVAYGLLNRDGRDLAWQFVQANWPLFLERYGHGGHMLENFPSYVGQAFASHAKASEVRDFFAAHPHPAITRPVAQAVESIELKADWAQRDQIALATWLEHWQPTSS